MVPRKSPYNRDFTRSTSTACIIMVLPTVTMEFPKLVMVRPTCFVCSYLHGCFFVVLLLFFFLHSEGFPVKVITTKSVRKRPGYIGT